MKMLQTYAEEFLSRGSAGHWRTLSCRDNLLVIEDLEDYQNSGYLGTKIDNNGNFETVDNGYVVFKRVTPVIDKDTRFTL